MFHWLRGQLFSSSSHVISLTCFCRSWINSAHGKTCSPQVQASMRIISNTCGSDWVSEACATFYSISLDSTFCELGFCLLHSFHFSFHLLSYFVSHIWLHPQILITYISANLIICPTIFFKQMTSPSMKIGPVKLKSGWRQTRCLQRHKSWIWMSYYVVNYVGWETI